MEKLRPEAAGEGLGEEVTGFKVHFVASSPLCVMELPRLVRAGCPVNVWRCGVCGAGRLGRGGA